MSSFESELDLSARALAEVLKGAIDDVVTRDGFEEAARLRDRQIGLETAVRKAEIATQQSVAHSGAGVGAELDIERKRLDLERERLDIVRQRLALVAQAMEEAARIVSHLTPDLDDLAGDVAIQAVASSLLQFTEIAEIAEMSVCASLLGAATVTDPAADRRGGKQSGRRAERPLDDREVAVLKEAGLTPDGPLVAAASPIARTAADFARLLATSLTVAEAAERLASDPDQVRTRLADKTLYGIQLANDWRLPLFQFGSHGVVPHWDEISPKLAGIHPVVVNRWFTLPHVDLVQGDEEESVSPREWLEAGGDPLAVVGLIDELRSGG